MLTTSETAKILGVSRASVRVWLSEEGHPRFPNARKFGRDWQIPESDLAGMPRGRKPGRPPKPTAGNREEPATAEDAGDLVEAPADEPPAKPKRGAVKRASAKKASKRTRSKKATKRISRKR